MYVVEFFIWLGRMSLFICLRVPDFQTETRCLMIDAEVGGVERELHHLLRVLAQDPIIQLEMSHHGLQNPQQFAWDVHTICFTPLCC